MKARANTMVCVRWLPLALALALAVPASARTFSFSQTGYSGGGSLSGSFEASDLDHNGQISSFHGEVSAYSMSFSGDSLVRSFSHGDAEFYGLVYDLDGGKLGDGSSGDLEGVASNLYVFSGISYKSGLGPNGVFGGSIQDWDGSGYTETKELVSVVPEPAMWLMLLAGMVAVPAARRLMAIDRL